MPNGGSDCCGTCWFNRANRSRAGSVNHDHSIPSHCEVRDVAIDDPFYTYCANHPYRRPDRDPVPIGPILRPGAVTPETPEIAPTIMDTGTGYTARVVWKSSPDTEEIRQHLLRLLADLEAQAAKDTYFPTPSLAAVVIWQLGEFQEVRAVPGLKRIVERYKDRVADDAKKALAKIRQATSGELAEMGKKQPDHPRQLFLDVLDWLRTTYASHRFFLQRDVAWTVQKRLLDRIGPGVPEYRVIHNRKVPKGKGPQFDLAVVSPNGTVEFVLKLKFEPAHKLEPGKNPVVEWTTVVGDVQTVQRAAEERHTRHAYSLFIDEGVYYRAKREPPPNSRWEEWDVGNGARVAVLISEAQDTAARTELRAESAVVQ